MERIGIEITGDASGLNRTLQQAEAQLRQFGVVGASGFSRIGESEQKLAQLAERATAGIRRINQELQALERTRSGSGFAQRERELTSALNEQLRTLTAIGREQEKIGRLRAGATGGGAGGGGLTGMLGGAAGVVGLGGLGAAAAGAIIAREVGKGIDEYRGALNSQVFLAGAARRADVSYATAAADAARLAQGLNLSTADAQRISAQSLRLTATAGRPQDASRLARNLTAGLVAAGYGTEELPTAFTQLATGQDEIFDKLGIGANPSDLYERWAKAAGRTVNSLTEVEKLQIRINTVIAEGEKSIGALNERMNSNIGILDRWKANLADTYSHLGKLAAGAAAFALDPFRSSAVDQRMANLEGGNALIVAENARKRAVLAYQGVGLSYTAEQSKNFAAVESQAAMAAIQRAAQTQAAGVQAFLALGPQTRALETAAAVRGNPLLGPLAGGTAALEALRLQGLALPPELRGALGKPAGLIGEDVGRDLLGGLYENAQSISALRARRRAITANRFDGTDPLYRITSDARGVGVTYDQNVLAVRDRVDESIKEAKEAATRVAGVLRGKGLLKDADFDRVIGERSDEALLKALAGVDTRYLDDNQQRLYAEALQREENRRIEQEVETGNAISTMAQFIRDLQTGGTAATEALKNILKLGITLDVVNGKVTDSSIWGNGTVTRGTAGGRR